MNWELESRIERLSTNVILCLLQLASVVSVTYLGTGTTVEELPPLDWRWAYPCSIFMIMHGCRRTPAPVGGAIPRQGGLGCKGKVAEPEPGSIPSVLFRHGSSFRTCLQVPASRACRPGFPSVIDCTHESRSLFFPNLVFSMCGHRRKQKKKQTRTIYWCPFQDCIVADNADETVS